MKVAIVVGHSKHSVGACNKTYNICEYQWNKKFAQDLVKLLSIDYEIVYRESLMKLPSQVNFTEADFVISLHSNAFNTQVGGCETLYYHKSKAGEKLASILQEKVAFTLYNKNRGIRPKTSEDRGGFLLRYTEAPCIIAEPFFIDNDIDFMNAQIYRGTLLAAFKDAIEQITKYIEEK